MLSESGLSLLVPFAGCYENREQIDFFESNPIFLPFNFFIFLKTFVHLVVSISKSCLKFNARLMNASTVVEVVLVY